MKAAKQKPKLLFDVPEDQPTAPVAVSTATKQKTTDGWIDDLVGALCDPIIVYPGGGWENDIPENLKTRLPLDRMAHLMKVNRGLEPADEACDLEALLYLYPASLAAPMSHEWANIYIYLGTTVMGNFPDDIKRDELSDYDMSQLRDLKRWIHKKKVEARKLKKKGEQVKAVQDRKYEQLAMEI